ncbi:LAFA_0D15280g1_1 [Lachancea sp. 'fantastica']|nr:LAFA_0D15280g1_1 [Lachancea sp. 'fantastica']
MRIRELSRSISTATRPLYIATKTRRFKWIASGSAITTSILAYYLNERWHQKELSPDHFIPYKISYNDKIDSEHFMLELTPSRPQKIDWWKAMSSDKLWSIEVKQSEIMVVRNYTPLPLEHVGNGQIQRFPEGTFRDGKLFFYLKKYKHGEVARWLSKLPEGHIVELRGPFIDFEMPSHPVGGDKETAKGNSCDIVTFTAGTGIAPIAQMLLTTTPHPGKILMFHSCLTRQDLGPLQPFLEESQNSNRIQLHYFESKHGRDIRKIPYEVLKLIPTPCSIELASTEGSTASIKPNLALVCGPDSYINTVSGPKHGLLQGPIRGMLAQRNWDNSNVFKLS